MFRLDRLSHTQRIMLCLIASLVSIVVCLSPYLFEGLLLPKSEDFEYTLVPTLFSNQARSLMGTVTWNWQVGLGSPWPLRIGMDNSPFYWVLEHFPLYRAVAIVTAIHMTAAYAALIGVYRFYGLRIEYAILGATIYILAPTLEVLYNSDAYAVYYTALFLPILFRCLLGVLQARHLVAKTIWAVLLGLAGGLAIRDGHIGVLPIYVVAILIFLVATGRTVVKSTPFGVLSACLTLYIGWDSLGFLLHEASLFSPAAPRMQDPLHNGIGGIFQGLFLWPTFGLLPPSSIFPSEIFDNWARNQALIRNVAVGPILSILLIWNARNLWADDRLKPLFIAGWLTLLIMAIPLSWLPSSISASWPLRDFVNLSFCICGLYTLQTEELRDGLRRRLLVAQIGIVVLAIIPLVFRPYVVNDRGYFSSGLYSRIAGRDFETDYIAALKEGTKDTKVHFPRIAASSRAWANMDVETGIDRGIINNISILSGFSEVTFVAKGISFDSIRTSAAKPYGTIVGSLVGDWALTPGNFDWITDDQALLTLLGIEVIVATEKDAPKAPFLQKYRTITTRDGFTYVFYKNRNTLKPAFFVENPKALDAHPTRCKEEILVCYDVKNIISSKQNNVRNISYTGSSMTIDIAPETESRLLLVTYMNREGLVITDEQHRTLPAKAWAGLVAVTVPAGSSQINLRYGSDQFSFRQH